MTTFVVENDFINKTSTETSIGLIITSRTKSFQNTGVIEIDVSDHHLLTVSFLKVSFTEMPPNKLHYCKYKSFDKIGFQRIFQTYLKKQITQN